MSIYDNQLIKPATAQEMVDAFETSKREITTAYLMLAKEQKRLKSAFGGYSVDVLLDRQYLFEERPHDTIDKVIDKIRRTAWRRIIHTLKIESRMTEDRKKKLQENIERGELPELTVENIFALLEKYMEDAKDIQKEMIDEVFKTLTPQARWGEDFKTNDKFIIGDKVILSGFVQRKWSGGGFEVGHYWQSNRLNTIDRVFYMLDGKTIPEANAYNSPLYDAIASSENGIGETDYYKFKCYKKGTLHLEFKRMDLVEQLNAIAGGMNLHKESQSNMF